MQIIRSQQNIVEKVFKDSQGRLIRARFAVYEAGGRIKARLLDWELIEAISGPIRAILGHIEQARSVIARASANLQSSIFNFQPATIYSIGSKPRAPTF